MAPRCLSAPSREATSDTSVDGDSIEHEADVENDPSSSKRLAPIASGDSFLVAAASLENGERLRLPLRLLNIAIEELSEQIKKGPFEHDASREFQRLIRKMNLIESDAHDVGKSDVRLDVLQRARRTTRKHTMIDEYHREHPWHDSPYDTPLSSRRTSRKTTIASTPKISIHSKQLNNIVNFLTDDSLTGTEMWKKTLVDVFHELDADGSGTLSTEELRAALQAVGVPKARTQKILLAVDTDGSGEIDFSEWKVALGRHSNHEELVDISNRWVQLKSNESMEMTQSIKRSSRCMLRPDRPLRLAWDIFLGILCFYVAIVLPFTTGFAGWFDDATAEIVSGVELGIDLVFLMDVCLNFRTGIYVVDGDVDLSARNVARSYLTTWFFLDLFSSIPFEHLSQGHLGSVRALKLLKIPKLIRAFRVIGPLLMSHSELVSLADELFQSPLLRVICRRSSIIVATIVLCHWLSCMMAYCSSTWLIKYLATMQQEVTIWRAYLCGMYWSMTTMTTVGYGDITGETDMERIYSVFAMVIGGAYYGYAVGTMCSIVSNRDLNASAYHNRMDAIYAWLDHHQLPTELRRRILRYFKSYLIQKAVVREADVINDLSPTLRVEVAKLVIHEDILNNPLFDNLPLNAVIRLQQIVQKINIDEGHSVVEKGEAGTAMFIVSQGMVRLDRVDVKGDKAPPRVLSAGDSFGEEILVGLEERYGYTVTAVKKASLYMIEEENFMKLFLHMPDITDQVVENASALYADANRQLHRISPVPQQHAAKPKDFEI